MKKTFVFILTLYSLETMAQNTEVSGQKTSDSSRGCCVWKTEQGSKCVAANHGYCRTKAGKANLSYEFYKGTRCKNISFCPIETK